MSGLYQLQLLLIPYPLHHRLPLHIPAQNIRKRNLQHSQNQHHGKDLSNWYMVHFQSEISMLSSITEQRIPRRHSHQKRYQDAPKGKNKPLHFSASGSSAGWSMPSACMTPSSRFLVTTADDHGICHIHKRDQSHQQENSIGKCLKASQRTLGGCQCALATKSFHSAVYLSAVPPVRF